MEDTIDPRWRKTSYSGNGGASCVEVGQSAGAVLVRDTKDNGHGRVLRLPADAWEKFVTAIRGSLTDSTRTTLVTRAPRRTTWRGVSCLN